MKKPDQQLSARCVAFVRRLARKPCENSYRFINGQCCSKQTKEDQQLERKNGQTVPCWPCKARNALKGSKP